MADLIEFSGSEIEFNGHFFEGDLAVKLKTNLSVHVGQLAENARKSIVRTIANRPYPNARARQPSRRRTGFTQRNIEVYQDPPNSLFAKVRMKPEVERPNGRGTPAAPVERLPYIVLAVMETGYRGGQHVYDIESRGMRLRSRTKWQHGERQGNQRPLYAFKTAAAKARARAAVIRESLVVKDIA